jgi:hypothetical protein
MYIWENHWEMTNNTVDCCSNSGFNHEIYGLQHVLSTKYEDIRD